jgi:multidrug transporter EmrE-like cation transporter
MYLVYLAVFWLMQAVAQVFFKYGSDHPERFWLLFFCGHTFGLPSIIFLMALYKSMNPNLALGLGAGGAFLSAQLAIAAVFRSNPTMVQYAGMLAITGGMVVFTLGNRG